MNITIKKSLALSIATFISYNLFATTAETSDYELVAYSDCEVVHRVALTKEQKIAYDLLNKESSIMEGLEKPIQLIQPSLDKLNEEMKVVSKLAVQETDNTIRIDKEAMTKQAELADKIDAIIKDNAENFKALRTQGKRIESAANEFEALLQDDLALKNYQYIQIFTDNKTQPKCRDVNMTS